MTLNRLTLDCEIESQASSWLCIFRWSRCFSRLRATSQSTTSARVGSRFANRWFGRLLSSCSLPESSAVCSRGGLFSFEWNSSSGVSYRRSVGISTFWFQSICANHIVWDATEVVDFSRKHTGQVQEGLVEIRQRIEALVRRRNDRRDSVAATIRKAMAESLGDTADIALQALTKQAIPRASVTRAIKELGDAGKSFTLWNLVDALTRFHTSVRYAGERADRDQFVGKLLGLVA